MPSANLKSDQCIPAKSHTWLPKAVGALLSRPLAHPHLTWSPQTLHPSTLACFVNGLCPSNHRAFALPNHSRTSVIILHLHWEDFFSLKGMLLHNSRWHHSFYILGQYVVVVCLADTGPRSNLLQIQRLTEWWSFLQSPRVPV